MKKALILSGILHLTVGTAVMGLQAEDKAKHDPQKMEAMMKERTDKRMEEMTKKLELTADQQKSVRTALDERNAKIKELGKDAKDQRKAIREETDSKILATLNDKQKESYKAMQKEMKEKHGDRMEKKDHSAHEK